MITEEVRNRFSIYQRYVENYGRGSDKYSGLRATHRLGPWIPLRYCEDDWILCVYVFRCSRDRYEIGFFLAEDHVYFVKDAGVMGGLVFCLSDAFFKTGRMEIHFSGPKFGQEATLDSGFEPTIPESVRRVADNLGVPLQGELSISDREGRELYARLTSFSKDTYRLLEARGIDPIQACFLVNRSVWRVEQIRLIAQEAFRPKALLEGTVVPDDWVSFKHDLIASRYLILGERAFSGLEAECRMPEQLRLTTWNQLDFMRCESLTEIAVVDAFGQQIKLAIGANHPFRLLPFSTEEYEAFAFKTIADKARSDEIVVVTRDFSQSSAQCRSSIGQLCEKKQVRLYSILDTTAELDVEFRRRLMQSASTRRPLQERPE